MKFTLSRPDATFLHVLAINFSFTLPKEAIEEHGEDFGRNPVGTGAFKMTDWSLGQHVLFERNADDYRAGLPSLDQIEFQVGQEPLVGLWPVAGTGPGTAMRSWMPRRPRRMR